MADVDNIKALIAQVTGDSAPRSDDADWRDWRFGVEAGGAPARAELTRIGAPAVPYLIERIDDNYVRWVLRDIGDAAVMPLIAALDDPQRRSGALGLAVACHLGNQGLNMLYVERLSHHPAP